MAITGQDNQAVVDEARKTAETAGRLANGQYAEHADQVRVLAGMIQKLAEHVTRLAAGDASSATGDARSRQTREAEAAVEEDQTPRDAPADPINERT